MKSIDAEIKIAAGIAVVLTLILVWWFVIGKPARDRHNAAESKAAATVAKGQAGAAIDAQAIVIDSSRKLEAAKELTRENENEIRSAEGSSVVVGTDANLAGLRGLCRRPTYSADERCRELLKANPR